MSRLARVFGLALPGFLLLATAAAGVDFLAPPARAVSLCVPSEPGGICDPDRVSAASAAEPAPRTSEAQPGGRSVEEIEGIVRDYLLAHPELLLEVQEALQRKMRDEQAARDQQTIAQNATALFLDPEAPVGGNPDGTITFVEFFDYQCGYCRRAKPVLDQILASNADVRIVYKEFPILGDESVLAARAALAARPQGLYHEFHAALMQADGPFTDARIMEIATEAGLDAARLATDMEDPAIQTIIDDNRRLARSLDIRGTPTFVTGDTLIRGALGLEQFQALIADMRLAQTGRAE